MYYVRICKDVIDMRKIWKLSLVSLVFVLALIASYYMTFPQNTQVAMHGGNMISILAIGELGDLSQSIVNALKLRGVTVKHLIAPEDVALSELADKANITVVLIDGRWLNGHVNDEALHVVIREALHDESYVLCIGYETSKLFELLDAAEVYTLPVENGITRNPAHDNPTMASFKLNIALNPVTGEEYYVPAIIGIHVDSEDPIRIANAMLNALNHYSAIHGG